MMVSSLWFWLCHAKQHVYCRGRCWGGGGGGIYADSLGFGGLMFGQLYYTGKCACALLSYIVVGMCRG